MLDQTLHNRYHITARIGSGAMGTVYRATDSQAGDEVAVKVIARELAFDAEMLERFRREGEALRQLRHPNIVEFVDTFQHEGQQVIVMEYVPGGSLYELIKQGPLPVERSRRIALELCDALTRAHHLDIVHRDIKPENVLIAEDGTPKLTDFGVARLLSEGTRLTGTGMQVGTPYYMSPEAWEGRTLDAQADIWSLGIVFYEMLAGEVPFGGETLVAVMHKVLNSPLPDLNTNRAGVPPRLNQIIKRMLTRNKAKRYPTIRQIAADLELVSGTAVGKGSREVTYRAREEPKKRENAECRERILRVAPITLGGFAVIGLIAVVVWLFNELSLTQTVSQRTATAAMRTNQFATEIASRPTETIGPTSTIDINVAATLQQVATQTFAPFATQTQAALNTRDAATQSALQTNIALTPIKTSTITPIPAITSAPRPTQTPIPVITVVQLPYPWGCSPNNVQHGLIVFAYGAGLSGADAEGARAAVGVDTAGTVTVNGQMTSPASPSSVGGQAMNSQGRVLEPICSNNGCGFNTYTQIMLDPGEYEVRATWPRADGNPDPRGCTLTVN